MSLQQERIGLKDSLESSGLIAVEFITSRVNPPVALVSASDPYIDEGPVYSTYTVNYDITLITSVATNEVATNSLDDMIEKAFLATTEWNIDGVGAPFILEVNNAQYLAARMAVSRTIEI